MAIIEGGVRGPTHAELTQGALSGFSRGMGNLQNLGEQIQQKKEAKLGQAELGYEKLLDEFGGSETLLAMRNPDAVASYYSTLLGPRAGAKKALELSQGRLGTAAQDQLSMQMIMSGETEMAPGAVADFVGDKDVSGLRDWLGTESTRLEGLEGAELVQAERELAIGQSFLSSWDPNKGDFYNPGVEVSNKFLSKSMGDMNWSDYSTAMAEQGRGGLRLDQMTPREQSAILAEEYRAEQANAPLGIPTFAQGTDPMQQYEQATGDVHRPAMVGDKETIMNPVASEIFAPELAAMQQAAPNPYADLAPDTMPVQTGRSVQSAEIPTMADGGTPSQASQPQEEKDPDDVSFWTTEKKLAGIIKLQDLMGKTQDPKVGQMIMSRLGELGYQPDPPQPPQPSPLQQFADGRMGQMPVMAGGQMPVGYDPSHPALGGQRTPYDWGGAMQGGFNALSNMGNSIPQQGPQQVGGGIMGPGAAMVRQNQMPVMAEGDDPRGRMAEAANLSQIQNILAAQARSNDPAVIANAQAELDRLGYVAPVQEMRDPRLAQGSPMPPGVTLPPMTAAEMQQYYPSGQVPPGVQQMWGAPQPDRGALIRQSLTEAMQTRGGSMPVRAEGENRFTPEEWEAIQVQEMLQYQKDNPQLKTSQKGYSQAPRPVQAGGRMPVYADGDNAPPGGQSLLPYIDNLLSAQSTTQNPDNLARIQAELARVGYVAPQQEMFDPRVPQGVTLPPNFVPPPMTSEQIAQYYPSGNVPQHLMPVNADGRMPVYQEGRSAYATGNVNAPQTVDTDVNVSGSIGGRPVKPIDPEGTPWQRLRNDTPADKQYREDLRAWKAANRQAGRLTSDERMAEMEANVSAMAGENAMGSTYTPGVTEGMQESDFYQGDVPDNLKLVSTQDRLADPERYTDWQYEVPKSMYDAYTAGSAGGELVLDHGVKRDTMAPVTSPEGTEAEDPIPPVNDDFTGPIEDKKEQGQTSVAAPKAARWLNRNRAYADPRQSAVGAERLAGLLFPEGFSRSDLTGEAGGAARDKDKLEEAARQWDEKLVLENKKWAMEEQVLAAGLEAQGAFANYKDANPEAYARLQIVNKQVDSIYNDLLKANNYDPAKTAEAMSQYMLTNESFRMQVNEAYRELAIATGSEELTQWVEHGEDPAGLAKAWIGFRNLLSDEGGQRGLENYYARHPTSSSVTVNIADLLAGSAGGGGMDDASRSAALDQRVGVTP